MEENGKIDDWPLSTICWYAIFVWFGASLFSQSVYLGIYGTPYDANVILDSIGPFAWIIIAIEVCIWVTLAVLLILKFSDRYTNLDQKTTSTEPILPHN